jgi:hypothetical protein
MDFSNSLHWLPGLLRQQLGRKSDSVGPRDVYFALTDHFEPAWRRGDLETQRRRVRAWIEKYPAIASKHYDSEGKPPQHSFFYPEEEYVPEHIDAIARLARQGFGDVEVHLHHHGDNPEGLMEKLLRFTAVLHGSHGLLHRDEKGRISYGFIHGNFALNNSRPDGAWCGVDDESSILLETGCYADFTMPSAPSPTQSRKINSIYYAFPSTRRRGHDDGPDARAGSAPPAGLLMIQGPLGLNWHWRKFGLLPRIENADLSWHRRVTSERVGLWLDQGIGLLDAPDQVFVKLSTHGAQDRNLDYLLSEGLNQMWTHLESRCKRIGARLHYVTAHEMFLQVRAMEVPQGAEYSRDAAMMIELYRQKLVPGRIGRLKPLLSTWEQPE